MFCNLFADQTPESCDIASSTAAAQETIEHVTSRISTLDLMNNTNAEFLSWSTYLELEFADDTPHLQSIELNEQLSSLRSVPKQLDDPMQSPATGEILSSNVLLDSVATEAMYHTEVDAADAAAFAAVDDIEAHPAEDSQEVDDTQGEEEEARKKRANKALTRGAL